MTSKKILLVEDDISLGELLVLAMEKHGYQVTWYVRARLEQSGELIFMNDRGVESDFDVEVVVDIVVKNGTAVKENRHGYEFALVDSRLKGSRLQGIELTQELTRRGVKVIGSSGLSYLNHQLVKAGAIGGIEKNKIFTLVLDGDHLLHCVTLCRV